MLTRLGSRIAHVRSMSTSVVLKSRPEKNSPVGLDNFKVLANPVEKKADIVARTLFLSVDPYMRCRFNDDTGVDYVKPFQPEEPITSAAIAEVVEVNNPASKFKKGDLVLEWFDKWPWQSRVELSVDEASQLKVIPASVAALVPVTYFLGGVGQTGLSAYFGILGETNPGPEDTVIISGAAGAVGSVVGQLAKSRGSYVVGICGNDPKGQMLLDSFKLDAYVNYKSSSLAADLSEALGGREATIYFDNVGGKLSDLIVSTSMASSSSVIICGQIDMYDTDKDYPPPLGEKAEEIRSKLGIKRERYLVFNYENKFNDALMELLQMAASEDLQLLETYETGIEQAPAAFCNMMKGKNMGKMLVECVPASELPSNLRFFNTLRTLVPKQLRRWIAKTFVKL